MQPRPRPRPLAGLMMVALLAAPALAGSPSGQESKGYPGVPAVSSSSEEVAAGIVQAPAPAIPQAPADPTEPAAPNLLAPRQAPVPEARVGVDESNPLMLSMTQAVEMALVRNRDIEVERINSQQAGFDLEAARGVYGPMFHSTDFFETRITPTASTLGGGANGKINTKTLSNDVTIRQLTRSGGFYEIGATSLRTDTNNLFSTINPQYQTGLTFTVRQPLLKNREIDENRRRLLVAQRRLDLSDAQFRQRVVDTIGAVQRGYWDLTFALRNLQVARESVDLAESQLGRIRRLVDQGLNPPVEIVQVDAELERRRENVLGALEAVTVAENALKALILTDRAEGEWNRPILPSESPSVVPVKMALTDAVAAAIRNRPELASLAAQREINAIDTRFFKDQTKPQLDLFASYGLTGLAGSEVTASPSPLNSSNVVLRDRINEISTRLGLEPLPATPPASVPGGFVGGIGQSLQGLLGNDFRAVRVGVELTIPVDNRTAQANLGRAEAEERKIGVQRQALEQRVEREVRNALQAVQTARQRVDTARASREASEVQLESEQRRQTAGLSTNFLVLTRQNDLAEARARELRALTDYNKAVVELQRVIGTTLSVSSVDLETVRGTTEGQ